MVGGQCVLDSYVISDGEAPSVICVNIGDWFEPNVNFF